MVMGEKRVNLLLVIWGHLMLLHLLMFLMLPCHMYLYVKCEQPLVRTSSTISEIINSDPTATCVDHFATALLAQQLPPLPKFSGESSDGELEIKTFQEWLDQFEMADVCNWSLQARLINLITRLRGQTYAFFRSCTMEQRSNYLLLVAELQKRFTPVHWPTEQSSLFYKKQGLTESFAVFLIKLTLVYS